jgi:hypothetical protein
MTLDDTLRTKLAELPDEPSTLQLDVASWTVALTVERHDVLGCLLSEVTLRRGKPLAIEPRAWAEGLTQRVTGLLEPLKLHELEAARDLTLLRSQAPTSRGDALQYYEVELHGQSEIRLRRYQGFAEAGKKREPVGFALTYEGLAKLLQDLSAEK